MKKTIIAGVAGAAIAGAISLGAATAQATPGQACSYFGSTPSQGICGAPSITGSLANAAQNLRDNFSASQAAKNVQSNFSPSNAASNLQHALTHGVGSGDNAP